MSVADLAALVAAPEAAVNDADVARVLCERLENAMPYTWASATMLVAANPYREQTAADEAAAAGASVYHDLVSAEPHPYTLAARVYHRLLHTQAAQAVLYSGVTDAGKTHCMHLVTEHLLMLSAAHSQREARTADQVRCALHILGAMGAARTQASEQASRHATYLELHFTRGGRLGGAKLLTFGLDKHRLHELAAGERTYAVFYQLLAGATRRERVELRLDDVVLGGGVPTREDARGYEWTRSALATLGLKERHVRGVFRVLAGILHLGAIDFVDDGGGVRAAQPAALERAASVLGVPSGELEQSLVMDTRYVVHERMTHILDVRGARLQRDALAQNLYAVLFAFVVEAMNQRLAPRDACPLHVVQYDAPGFVARTSAPSGPARAAHYDDLAKNYMADLVRHLSVQAAMEGGVRAAAAAAGIPLPPAALPGDCMSLLRGGAVPLDGAVPPVDDGVLGDYAHAFAAVLRGERAADDDAALVRDLERHASHRAFIPPDPRTHGERLSYDVNHALGPCTYTVAQHTRSELDLLPTQQYALLKASAEPFVARLFAGPGLCVESRLSDERIVLRAQVSSRPLRRASALRPGARATWGGDGSAAGVLQQLDATVIALLRTMQAADTCWQVLCVRSNDLSQPNACDSRRVAKQVHGLGVPRLLGALRYSYMPPIALDEFAERYGPLDEVAAAHGWAVPADVAVGPESVCLSYAAWCAVVGRPTREVAVDPPGAPPSPPLTRAAPSAELLRGGTPDKLGMPGMDEPAYAYGERELEPVLDKETLLLPTDVEEEPVTRTRRLWSGLTTVCTWWIPTSVLTHVLGMTRPDVRRAWREKVTICMLIFLLCAAVLFYIIGIGKILCPDFKKAWNKGQLSEHDSGKSMYVAVQGQVYDITKFFKLDHSDIPGRPVTGDVMNELAGKDLTAYFPVPLSAACSGLVSDPTLALQQHENLTAEIPQAVHVSGAAQKNHKTKLHSENWYYHRFLPRIKAYHKGDYVYDKSEISSAASWRNWAIADGDVYDLTNYVYTQSRQAGGSDKYAFLPNDISDLFQAQAGADISGDLRAALAKLPSDQQHATRDCLRNAFYAGRTDFRLEPRCEVQNYLLLSFSCIVFASILAKFVSALQLTPRPMPEQQERFVICHVPCYTEGEDELRKTIDSLALQDYDDKRKLLFLVCDGMIVGSGNDRPTPRILLDILGVDAQVDPEPLPFKSVADGSKQLNYGKVYSGLYEYEGHVVPFVVVVKVGRPSERSRPGNRGKRDTQIMLMRFLNRVHFDAPMYPLELELFHHMRNVIGIDPSFYEYLLMVDADTVIAPDGMNRLVAACVDDPTAIAVCGETLLQNEQATIWTMVQVYEYYISHNLAKAFESLFGSVTCLPGCFTMYRLRSANKGRPLFVSDRIIDDYSENRVDTLHKKNLLSLGEDRYLTTLLLKHFPLYRTKFRSDASALTNAPESFMVLLSQRRRWINSTVHNLVELVRMKGLCGFCLFSMRFIVFIDLLGTIILPATAVYIVYLIVTIALHSEPLPIIALVMIGAVYGLQAVIFLLKRQWQYIGWMVIYMLAFPLYAFLLPIYSFWHMDDFSWGDTRIVVGEKGNKKVVAGTDDEPYHDAMIPRKRFTEYEQELDVSGHVPNDMLLYDPPAYPSPAPDDDYFQQTNLLRKKHTSVDKRAVPWELQRDSLASVPSRMSMFGPPMPPLSGDPRMSAMLPAGDLPMPPPFPWDMRASLMPSSLGHGSFMPDPRASFLPSETHARPISQASLDLLPPFTTEDPSDDQIRAAITSFLAAQPSLMQVTKRHVREAVAAAIPNADLTSKKALINRMIDELLSGG